MVVMSFHHLKLTKVARVTNDILKESLLRRITSEEIKKTRLWCNPCAKVTLARLMCSTMVTKMSKIKETKIDLSMTKIWEANMNITEASMTRVNCRILAQKLAVKTWLEIANSGTTLK